MRKVLLPTVLFGLLFSVTFGQSISLSNTEGEIPANSVVTGLVDAGTGTYGMHLFVTNNSTSPVGVLVKKVENYLEGETIVSFCWAGQCYGPGVIISPNADTLQPGETNYDDFIADLFPQNEVGISSVTYVFFDEDNVNDSVSVVLNYAVTSTQSSFALSNNDGDLENNGDLSVSGLAGDESLTSYVQVTNTGNDDLEVKVRRIETNMPLETSSYFTWVDTYPSSTDVSPTGVIISPDATYSFSGDFEPNGMPGDATISYVFFDANDLSNFSTINVNYTASPVGIEDNSMNSILLSNAYPNPAKSVVSLNYDLKGFNDAKLVIYNLLGSAVKDVQINEAMGKLDINVNDLEDGIYFYSLLVNNEIVKTQKLMIRH